MKNTTFQIQGGWQIIGFRLVGSEIQNITMIGLDLNTNYYEVARYLNKYVQNW